jgi:hypothetical protein
LRRRGELQRHRDLATRHLPERPGVLPGHAHGLLALLGEPGVVDNQKAVGAEPAADPGAQPVEDVLLVPRALVEELLQRLLVIFVALLDGLQPRRHGFDALPVAVEEDPAQIGVAPAPPPRVAQGARDVVQELRQFRPEFNQLPCIHRPILTRTARTVKPA